MAIPRTHPIIVFDGKCVLCTANARFILKHDKLGKFRLTAMQSDIGAQIMRDNGLDPLDPESFILLDPVRDGAHGGRRNAGRIWMNSDAVLHMWSQLGWPWRAGAVFKIIPRAVRDPIYRLVARNRYRWFGVREECWVPAADEASRIL